MLKRLLEKKDTSSKDLAKDRLMDTVAEDRRKLSGVEVDILRQRQLKLAKEFEEQKKFNQQRVLKAAQVANPIKPRKRKKRNKKRKRRNKKRRR